MDSEIEQQIEQQIEEALEKALAERRLVNLLRAFEESKYGVVLALIYTHCQTLSEVDALKEKILNIHPQKTDSPLSDPESNEPIARVLYEAGVRMYGPAWLTDYEESNA